jgi:uncharacterized protein YecT (DUF1311 family)
MRLFVASSLVAILLSNAAEAQVPNPIDCSRASSTVEMNYCSEQAYLKADEALNEAYKAVMKHIRENGGAAPYDSKSWEEALKTSQRAWIAFRDAECKGLVPMEWSGGTGTTTAVNGCLTGLTEARTRALKERYAAR